MYVQCLEEMTSRLCQLEYQINLPDLPCKWKIRRHLKVTSLQFSMGLLSFSLLLYAHAFCRNDSSRSSSSLDTRCHLYADDTT